MRTTPDHSVLPPAAGTDAPTRQASEPVGARTVEGPIYRPDMLMIGSFARNSGKTELACRIIRRHADEAPVVGLKVTTVEQTDGRCPHGEAGCGVCSSHAAPWVVSRELDREPPKDTCRLLASGAHEVYWLRVLRSALADGAAGLLSHVPEGRLSVCESNRLRTVVEPGLFLQVRTADADSCKPSALAVAHLADLIVASDGRSFDLDLGRISLVRGQWALRREACAVVVDDADGYTGADRAAVLRRTRRSLEPLFDRVEIRPAATRRSARLCAEPGAADLPHEWCFVTPPIPEGVAPGLVNAMFRRRQEVDVVFAVRRCGGMDVCLALCRRPVLAEVIAAIARGPGAIAALGDRCALTELRPGLTDPGVGHEPLPEPAAAHLVPVSHPANRGGAETS